eukprot:TRINITY_DN2158_c0_g2_i3.p1 TRINITY_DN2158_c0_g2~~TRINITY_DN2158_c0_g2_i3.p1  ORF type:complete len:675 (+),score=160.37 TRINITY_DN2158_c0_g2_i3:174-2198(+)
MCIRDRLSRTAEFLQKGLRLTSDREIQGPRVHRIPLARHHRAAATPTKNEGGIERLSEDDLERVLTEREIPHMDCRTKEELAARLEQHDNLGRRSPNQNGNGQSSPCKKRAAPKQQKRPSHQLMAMNRRNNPTRRPSPNSQREEQQRKTASPGRHVPRHSFHDPNSEVEIFCKPPPAPPEHQFRSPQQQESVPAQALPSRTEELLKEHGDQSQPWVVAKAGSAVEGEVNSTQEQEQPAVSDLEAAQAQNHHGVASALQQRCCSSEVKETLFTAAQEGDIEELQSLLGEGADSSLLSTRHDESGATVLHQASEAGHVQAVVALVRAAQHEAKKRGPDSKRALNEWLNARDHEGNTALHISAAAGHTLLVRQLMQSGADPDALDLAGRTASQVAATEALQLAMANTRVVPQELRLRTGVFAGGTYMPSARAGVVGRRRVALVMGNDNYSGGVSKLTNCVNDAKDMAGILQQLNFMVMVVSDQSRSQMLACIRAFRQGIRDSDIVLVYFSGHGVEHEGVPYLLPLGANAVHSSDYELEAVSLNWILKTLNTVEGGTTNLLFLDSCRLNITDDTFKGEGGAVGYSMKGFRAPSGAEYCIALSSDPGTASHSAPQERNSVFTEHLLSCLANQEVNRLDVELMLRHVREGVMAATSGKQRPWTQSCLGVDGFRFLEPKTD